MSSGYLDGDVCMCKCKVQSQAFLVLCCVVLFMYRDVCVWYWYCFGPKRNYEHSVLDMLSCVPVTVLGKNNLLAHRVMCLGCYGQ